MIVLPIVTTSLINLSLKGWDNVLFDLGRKRVKLRRFTLRAEPLPLREMGGRGRGRKEGRKKGSAQDSVALSFV